VPKGKLPPQLKQLGANVRRIRNSIGMTQERLAELVDINIRNVQRIEAGEINLLITTVARIRRALGCSWNDMMPGDWR